ncbi:MAG: L-fucose:H+ symporter permease [Bacteroidaceae bacterium]|nr:L-fucose:H+ symporter permease [Bacteroidaceae bacterium]
MNKLVEKKYLITFILITSLFALWGFANDITNPMVAAFQTVMELSAFEASWVQCAFYGGYATMALPAAFFIRRYSYKSGILLGLGLYAIGAFLFIPAAAMQNFIFFCLSLYILTFGLAFLETTANPFILSLGSKETSTRRLNLAQAFNPMGSLSGMAVASLIVLPQLWSDRRNEAGEIIFGTLSEAEKADIRLHDLAEIRDPYVALGVVVVIMFLIIAFKKMPKTQASVKQDSAKMTLRRLWHNTIYREGVMAQMFYVAAQIMVWTFIIQYADHLGINKATAQNYNIFAMGMFLCSRFISTFLMKYVNSRRLLAIFGIGAMICTAGAICIVGMPGLYCLVGISAFMSLMFPTIYGIALENVEAQDTSLGAAFLVMAIVGGAIMPPLQGSIIDLGEVMGHPAVNFSFILPFICFAIITVYGIRAYRKMAIKYSITFDNH